MWPMASTMSSQRNSMGERPLASTSSRAEESAFPGGQPNARKDAHPVAGILVPVMDPRELYTVDEAVVAKLKEHRPVLIHQLDGFVDAGQAGRLFSANLLDNLEHEALAEFDHIKFHDNPTGEP